MSLPSDDSQYLHRLVDPILDELGTASGSTDTQTGQLAHAFGQLRDIMQRVDTDAEAGARQRNTDLEQKDITELGEYAINLTVELSQWLAGANRTEDLQRVGELTIALALWTARRGGFLISLDPVVDSLAHLANRISDPQTLGELSDLMVEIIEATAPVIQRDLVNTDPARPWRILHLNLGIVATRSYNPMIMERDFGLLIKHIPGDVAGFFQEGMQQMDIVGYPDSVRAVMERYYNEWSVKHSLH